MYMDMDMDMDMGMCMSMCVALRSSPHRRTTHTLLSFTTFTIQRTAESLFENVVLVLVILIFCSQPHWARLSTTRSCNAR